MQTADPITVAVDLGGTSVRVGLFNAGHDLLRSHAMPTRVAAGPQSVMEEVATVARQLIAEQNAEAAIHVLGIGLGSPGPIDLVEGTLGLLPNFPGWKGFPLREALAQASGLPVYLEHDANAAALAEWKLGVGRATGLRSMAMFTLGTGVGGALILDGKMWHGIFGMGGEFGHVSVDPNGPVCACGTRGCLEAYASATGLLRMARDVAAAPGVSAAFERIVADPASLTALALASLASAGDESAQQLFASFGHYLGLGVANLISTLDPPLIVIGGGVASAWPAFAPAMFTTAEQYSTVYRHNRPTQHVTLEFGKTFICPAMLGPSAGLLGASLLPLMTVD